MPEAPHSLTYPLRVIQKSGRSLLHQQCWLWGQDIKRQQGNLLLQYGFHRIRPPKGDSGSSQYTLQVEGDIHVRLWGFGIYFGAQQGIFLNRYCFIPRKAVLEDLWQANEMTSLKRAGDFSLLPSALRWIAVYEKWVIDNYGLSYREKCLSRWRIPAEAPARLPHMWLRLAQMAEDLLQSNRSMPNKARLTTLSTRQKAQIN
jgi:hypothetical protein